MGEYEKAYRDGYSQAEESFKHSVPYWVYGATDINFQYDITPTYKLLGTFKDEADAEAFIKYRKSKPGNVETLFKIFRY